MIAVVIVAALVAGGVVAWEPYSSQARVRLADSAIAVPVQSGQPEYGLITCRNDWIIEHPEFVDRFLMSLFRAEDLVIRNSADAKAIIRKRLNYDAAFTETIWTGNRFALYLDQSHVTAVKDEGRWMIKNGLNGEKQIPDLTDYIHVGGLKAVKPEAVSIIQ